MKDILYPIRRIHGKLYEYRNSLMRNRAFRKQLNLRNRNNCFIIGSPTYTNLGDSAILLAQRLFLLHSGKSDSDIQEITAAEYREYRKTVRRSITKKQMIVGLGGGNMGNQWPNEERIRYDILDDFPHNFFVIFPQTVYFLPNSKNAIDESTTRYTKHKQLVMAAREQTSFELMKDLYGSKTILLTPDIVLSTTMRDYGVVTEERKDVLFCARSDAERAMEDAAWEELEAAVKAQKLTVRRTDMYSDIPVTKENRLECVRRKMQEFCSAKLVITDRLHGMVFAAITGTPCIAFSNYNYKVKGTYDWIRYLPYVRYAETVEDAIRQIPELLAMDNCRFDNKPLKPYFDELAEVIKKQCRK